MSSGSGSAKKDEARAPSSVLSTRKYRIPFGRYEGSDRAPAPAHESMIGRAPQRKRLLNLLFSQGRRGAYLITGHRGAGKTSFVEDGIATYRRDVFRRFLRSDVGRGFFWDRLGLLVLVVAVITGLLILKHLVWFLLLNPTAPRLPGLLAIPILVVFILPVFMAAGVIDPFVRWRYALKKAKADARARANADAKTKTNVAGKTDAEIAEIEAIRRGQDSLVRRVAIGGALVLIGELVPAVFKTEMELYPSHWRLSLLGRVLLWPWSAYCIAAGGAVLAYCLVRRDYSTLPEEPDDGDRQRVDNIKFGVAAWSVLFCTLMPVVAGIFSLWRGASALVSGSATVVFAGSLVGLTSRKGRKAAHNIFERNGADFLAAAAFGASVLLAAYALDGPAPAILPIGIVTAMSALISGVRANDLAREAQDAMIGVRRARLVIVGMQFLGALAVVGATIAKPWTLRETWPPVLVLTLGEVVIPHYFASVRQPRLASDQKARTGDDADAKKTVTRQEVREGTAQKDSAPDGEKGASGSLPPDARRRLPLYLTIAAKALGLVFLSANLIHPAVVWADSHLRNEGTPDVPWSGNLRNDLEWILWVVVFFLAITRLEYDWIHRTSHPRDAEAEPASFERFANDIQHRTLFYAVWSAWLPVLKVNVNLGIDALSHRRVVEVMMTALRDAFQRTFATRRSPLSVLGATVRLGVVLFFMTLGGSFFFSFSDPHQRLAEGNYCEDLRTKLSSRRTGGPDGHKISHAYDWACSTKYGNDIIRGIRFNVIDPSDSYRPVVQSEPKHLGHYFLPTSFFGWNNGVVCEMREQVELRSYHVLLILLLYWLTGVFLKRWPLLPYQDISERLQRVLDSLSSSIDEQETAGWAASGYIPLFRNSGRSVTKRTEPLDSRRVELMFLSVLRDIHFAAIALPFNENARLHLPAAEIIFVFDELDKASLELPRTPKGEKDPGPEVERRLASLLALFADMKNILSTAPARFFFVGGRDLHDAWLADQMARQPLLTRIFDDEVYLPSLLTDDVEHGADPHEQIESYLVAQMRRAHVLFEKWSNTRVGAWLGIWQEDRRYATFKPEGRDSSEKLVVDVVSEVSWLAAANSGAMLKSGSFKDDFIAFLAYRSSGNVKRLRELVEGFLHPTAGAERGAEPSLDGPGGSTATPRSEPDQEHELVFHDEDIHRVQLIGDIYRGIERVFRTTPMMRDDKVVTSLFYISNTLLKFHRQAFNLVNFERIDEVVDVHRSPEIRAVVHELLVWWTGPVLRTVHNGVFAYRFRSEVAQELRFAARLSEEEMAALHFALDESRTLKDLYRARLEASQTTPNAELAAALGEIHDQDGEYDSARYYYLFATKLLDEKLQFDIRGGYHDYGEGNAVAAIYEVLRGDPDGLAIAARRLPWASARLRLMLQIGLTYEHEKDHDRAIVEYRNARVLAHVILQALNAARGAPLLPGLPLASLRRLLVQPALAEIFAAEKAGVPASASDDELGDVGDGLGTTSDPNVLLARADVLARRADLHFFRGFCGERSEPTTGTDPARGAALSDASHRRSLDEYSAALQQLAKVPAPHGDRLCAKILSSLSDVLLARPFETGEPLSVRSFFREREGEAKDMSKHVKNAIDRVLGGARSDALFPVLRAEPAGAGPSHAWRLSPEWLWGTAGAESPAPESVDGSPLLAALLCSLAAAELMRREGSGWDAALEEQRISDALSRILWWRRLAMTEQPDKEARTTWEDLLGIADIAVAKAYGWWKRAGQSPVPASPEMKNDTESAGADRQWNALLVTVCRLQAIDQWLGGTARLASAEKIMTDLLKQIRVERGGSSSAGSSASGTAVRDVPRALQDVLSAYSFPMLARLRAMALWIEIQSKGEHEGRPVEGSILAGAVLDLVRSERAYRARLLFTPLELGVPLALFTKQHGGAEIEGLARAHLLRARRQVTRRRAYYEAISDMYYLADDFKEPRIRGGHALQMAAIHYVDELLEGLDRQNRH